MEIEIELRNRTEYTMHIEEQHGFGNMTRLFKIGR